MTCSRPWNPRSASVIACGVTPAIDAAAVAASTLCSMCRPVSSTAETGTSRSTPRRRAPARSSRRPRRIRRRPPGERERHAAARASPAPRCITTGSSAFTTAQSSAVWFAKIRALAAAYDVHVGMPIEVVVGKVQPDGDPRPERGGRLELEAARLDDVERLRRRRLRPARSAARRCCRRRAPCDRRPRSMRPISVVVVDFPLVPVIAMTRPLDPSPGELQLADDLDAALRVRRRRPAAPIGTPGLVTIRSAAGERLRPVAAQLQHHARRPQAIGAVEGVARFRERHARRPAARAAPRRRCRCAPRPPRPPAGPRPRTRLLPRHHRIFSVVRLKSAKITARIRNRVITFGSLHPISSK